MGPVVKPSLSLEELAAITAAIDSGGDREAVLAERRVTPERFDAAREAWMREVARRASTGDRALALRWTALVHAAGSTAAAKGTAAKKRKAGGKAPVAPQVRASLRTRAKPGVAKPVVAGGSPAPKPELPPPPPALAPPGPVAAPSEVRRPSRTLMTSVSALAAQVAPLPFAGASAKRPGSQPPAGLEPVLPFAARSADEPRQPRPAAGAPAAPVRARPPAEDDPLSRTSPQPTSEPSRSALPFDRKKLERTSPPSVPKEAGALPFSGNRLGRTGPISVPASAALPFDASADRTAPIAPVAIPAAALPFDASADRTAPIAPVVIPASAGLPFDPSPGVGAAARPSAPDEPARVRKPTERDPLGSTMNMAGVSPVAAAMPFLKKPNPGSAPLPGAAPASSAAAPMSQAPSTSPAGGVAEAAARRKAESFTLAQYARLGAELRLDPTQAQRLRASYGIDEATWLALHQVWKDRFTATPMLRARWESQVEQILAKLRGQ